MTCGQAILFAEITSEIDLHQRNDPLLR